MMLKDILDAAQRPEPYEPGEELWNDPHISKGMLEAHLSPDTDAASYRPEKIDAICDTLMRTMRLRPGDRVVDLGCGPGLYCAKLAGRGLNMTGIDRSENSIRYARECGAVGNAEYLLGSYLEPFGEGRYDAALMIYQDYGVLSPENRRLLLGNIRRALRPGGWFAFDVSGMDAYRKRQEASSPKWFTADSGFWRPHRHLVLEDTLFFSEISALCDRYFVLDEESLKRYRVWQTFFSPESIHAELTENGFRVEVTLGSLCGDAWDETSPELGVICRAL